jgi:hypothetical protein
MTGPRLAHEPPNPTRPSQQRCNLAARCGRDLSRVGWHRRKGGIRHGCGEVTGGLVTLFALPARALRVGATLPDAAH